ncbi:integrase/recombinase xerD homolog [Mixophyes fleayi]|uniref:integrase/recombinase xerD homolog n=1 Tax=Mixophyes fleayi TaxID=3061075 RepID=UPI003F4DA8B0
MRAVGGGRSGSESRDQRSAGIRVEPIPGSTDAQPGSASVVEASVAAGNPAPHDHQAGIRGLVEQAVAPSTLRTYRASWRRWSLFSGQKDQSEAGQRDAMLAFMWESYSKGEFRASMASTLAGISFMARLQGYTDVTKGFMISKALKGWARARPSQADARLPITNNILDQLIETLGGIAVDEYEKTLFSAAFSMAFFGAFRVSELVAKSRGHQESGLKAEHVSLCGGVVSCKIIRSKTDQSGRGAWVQLNRQPNSNICPVNLVSRFMNMRPQARLFLCHHNGMPMTKYKFSAIMKKSLQSLNLDSSMYGTHSFRIGAATSAALAGSSTETIKALGRWKSTAYKSYVRIDNVDV